VRSGDFPPAPVFEPRINNSILFSSSFSLNNTLFDVFSGLRVPQVHVSIVPDQMLPGDLASPFVTETSLLNPDTGVEELVHFVRIRESEAESSTITQSLQSMLTPVGKLGMRALQPDVPMRFMGIGDF
jgi:hypothetical protein